MAGIETYAQRYYQENKEKLKEKAEERIYCECGNKVLRKGMCVHKKTKIHQNRMTNKEYQKSDLGTKKEYRN